MPVIQKQKSCSFMPERRFVANAIVHLIVAVGFCAGAVSVAVADDLWGGSFSKLKTRVIRSIAVAPFDDKSIIVGNKGSKAGEAQLFASSDGGVSWRFLNAGKSLSPNATDVQSVGYVSPAVILAGTWKHGLFRSENSGDSFSPVSGLPVKDIRSLLVLASGRVLAATGNRGIWKSDDGGRTWSGTSQSDGYFWSLQSGKSGSVLLAASPATGLYQSEDSGNTWQLLLSAEGLYDAAYVEGVIAAVGDNGLLLSNDSGASWRGNDKFNGIRLSSIQTALGSNDKFLIGSWKDGLWEYSLTSQNKTRQHAAGLPVLHVRQTQQGALAGTWGRGLHIFAHSTDTNYLVAASQAADTGLLSKLLAEGANPDSYDENRNTALIFAARDGHIDMVTQLLSNGAEVNWIDGEGVTPLILAAFKNHPEVVKLLLANSADKTVVDGFGRTAIDYALRRGAADPIAVMLK